MQRLNKMVPLGSFSLHFIAVKKYAAAFQGFETPSIGDFLAREQDGMGEHKGETRLKYLRQKRASKLSRKFRASNGWRRKKFPRSLGN